MWTRGVFQGQVTFAVTYSDKSDMPGTRDVDAAVVVNVQFANDGTLKLTPEGTPDFWGGHIPAKAGAAFDTDVFTRVAEETLAVTVIATSGAGPMPRAATCLIRTGCP